MSIEDVDRRLNAVSFARPERAITKNSRAPLFARLRSQLFAPLIEVGIREAAQNERNICSPSLRLPLQCRVLEIPNRDCCGTMENKQ
jgi:hypothetical protein